MIEEFVEELPSLAFPGIDGHLGDIVFYVDGQGIIQRHDMFESSEGRCRFFLPMWRPRQGFAESEAKTLLRLYHSRHFEGDAEIRVLRASDRTVGVALIVEQEPKEPEPEVTRKTAWARIVEED